MKLLAALSIFGLIGLSPTQTAADAYHEQVIYSFHWRKGAEPSTRLLFADQGGFFGTTSAGGRWCHQEIQCGVVFELFRPRSVGAKWHLAVLHNFGGPNDGRGPQSLLRGPDGELYGTTESGGSSGCVAACGIAFELLPPTSGHRAWREKILHNFNGELKVVINGRVIVDEHGGIDGGAPQSGLIRDNAGALYGVTMWGGQHRAGAVFKLTPPSDGETQWKEDLIWSFSGGSDGANPTGGLVADAGGALYGTVANTASTNGAVFRLSPPAPGQSQWSEQTVYDFPGGVGGRGPTGAQLIDESGALYGTAVIGGALDGGLVYKLTPPQRGETKWTETILHSFGETDEAHSPTGDLSVDSGGALYGTTAGGGINTDHGVAYKLTPSNSWRQRWTETVLYSFGRKSRGRNPFAGLTLAKGELYGTTLSGGKWNNGAVFKLKQ